MSEDKNIVSAEDVTQSALLRESPNAFCRRPRVTAAVIFGLLGSIVASLVVLIFALPVDYAIEAGMAAALSGALCGGRLFDINRPVRIGRAIWIGARVVLVTQLLFSLLRGIVQEPRAGIAMLLFGSAFSLWITIPLGCITAVLLLPLRRWIVRPQACAVHGYSAVTAADEQINGN